MKRHWLLWCCLWILGCGAPLHEPKAPSGGPSPQPGLRVGVAEIDITPPLGPSLAGHGPEGRISRGYRGRLKCRALVAIDKGGRNLAWSVCDIWAPSALLHRRVAARTRQAFGLGADHLILSATHTHGGPAHYSGARNYNGPFTSERPAFDENLLNWLAERIARSIVVARQDALAGGDAKLSWSFGQLRPGLTRNRSVEPHCKNATPMPGFTSSCSKLPDPLEEVDRELAVLRVERAGKLTGVFAVASMHPTALPNTNEVFHADLFGVAARRLSYQLGERPVVAIANGLEGDVSPNLRSQSWLEAERLGRELAEDITQLVRSPAQVSGEHVARAYRELELRLPSPNGTRLCPGAAVGDSASGGAEDGRTRFYAVETAREGAKLEQPKGCHGPKRATTAFVTNNPWSFPTFTPMHVAELGGVFLLTLPFEMTTSAGLELRQTLEQTAPRQVVLLGLTNEYLQYVATPAEYAEQHYEGASTIYGPASAAFFRDHASSLLRAFIAPDPPDDLNQVPAREFRPGPSEPRLPAPSLVTARTFIAKPFLVPGEPGTWAVEWSVPKGQAETDIASGPLVRVETLGADGQWRPLLDEVNAPVDDTSTNVYIKRRRTFQTDYLALWQTPLKLAGKFRFVIGRAPVVIVSEEFSP